jgi:3-carboxy-cis,cis-muconate cycloisomerase
MAVNPADSPIFGTLYGAETMRAVFDEHALLQRMLDAEAALARVEARLGLIPEAAAAAITSVARVEALDLSGLPASTRNVGYPVVGLVAALSRAAGAEAGRWTHWGATTQDILDTAVALQVKAGLALLRSDLLHLIAALAEQAQAHRATVMAGRTHLQHALPITFGLKCAVWLAPLIAHVERLDQIRPRVELVELGGAAGTLASLGGEGLAVMAGLAEELALGVPPLPWHVRREGLAEAVSFLGLLCGSLGKFATDIILLAQTELAEVAEPHAPGRGSSSTMPQKRNPIAAEYVLAAMRAVQALVPLMLGAMAQDFERATGPWQAGFRSHPRRRPPCALHRGRHGGRSRQDARKPRCHRRADRRGSGDDGARAAAWAGCRPSRRASRLRSRARGKNPARQGARGLPRNRRAARCDGARKIDRSRELSRQHRRFHRPRADGGKGARRVINVTAVTGRECGKNATCRAVFCCIAQISFEARPGGVISRPARGHALRFLGRFLPKLGGLSGRHFFCAIAAAA